jgi:hypothetical protein
MIAACGLRPVSISTASRDTSRSSFRGIQARHVSAHAIVIGESST